MKLQENPNMKEKSYPMIFQLSSHDDSGSYSSWKGKVNKCLQVLDNQTK